jgi:hypothetical protein
MKKFKFNKCLSSHGVFLVARDWANNILAEYYPLYKEFHLIDKSYPELERYMRSYHFDHQFDEIPRFRQMNEFLLNKRRNNYALQGLRH